MRLRAKIRSGNNGGSKSVVVKKIKRRLTPIRLLQRPAASTACDQIDLRDRRGALQHSSRITGAIF
jgi:hypothetical protein